MGDIHPNALYTPSRYVFLSGYVVRSGKTTNLEAKPVLTSEGMKHSISLFLEDAALSKIKYRRRVCWFCHVWWRVIESLGLPVLVST